MEAVLLRMRWWPRSIRWQLLAGLLLLESLSISLYVLVLIRQQGQEVYKRAHQRLEYEARSLATQATEALVENRPTWVGLSVRMMGAAPTVAMAKITDAAGNMLYISKGDADDATLAPAEAALIPWMKKKQARCLTLVADQWECAHGIFTGSELRGIAWVQFDKSSGEEQLNAILRDTAMFAIIWITASALLAFLMGQSIGKPLAVLHRGASALTSSLENNGSFPLPIAVQNEIGDLIETFNHMVASLAEQRSGLNDTLSLLDSMLANAPIGLAFFDRNCRFVRVNQVFADLTRVPLSRHLGRTVSELLPLAAAKEMENAVVRVFANEEPVRNLELSGQNAAADGRSRPWTWLASAYPVRPHPKQVRWVGVIVLDASERKRGEEALRKSEKLAVTGRLAASIAHEINNPLEAVTNLLFLLRNYTQLDQQAITYVDMAELEVRRVAEITQQTLRFYRQSTLPARASMAELLDSVLALYQGRLTALGIHVERDYDPKMDLFCFAGEIRQVMANLVGNSIDAASGQARLLIRARRSHNWKNPEQTGVRFVVGDTGCGMEREVRERIFEPFFTTKEVTGTGLGLWVSQEIIFKHKGIVHVRSRTAHPAWPAQSTGTVFELFLPDDPSLANGTGVSAG
jgi:signal transduction histidine kinase